MKIIQVIQMTGTSDKGNFTFLLGLGDDGKLYKYKYSSADWIAYKG